MTAALREDNSLFRALPSMNAVLEALTDPDSPIATDAAALPRPMLRECAAAFLDNCREAVRQGRITFAADLELVALLPDLAAHVAKSAKPHLRKVLNATGVVIHTNLGRSLLAQEAAKAAYDAALSYSNLEFNLQNGARGSRYSHVEPLIRRLTGTEAALVVNNNAAAVLLVLDTLCKGREVVVSRGELVEIGGSFRIPEVMQKSGCILKEVGATNRTHLKDYENAITENTAALMKVHASNYRIIGFTSEVPREKLAALAASRNLPLIEDLGSGNLFDFGAAGLHRLATEPSASRVIASGVDVITFSGDKVLGGPQAGVIAGKADLLQRIKDNQLTRALRIDKMTLAALEATLRLYLDPELAKKRIPTLRMICAGADELKTRAQKLARLLRAKLPGVSVNLLPGASRTGGGAFPEFDLPTCLVSIGRQDTGPDILREALLCCDPPLIARVENNTLCLDPRTLADSEFKEVAAVLQTAFAAIVPRHQ